MGVLADVLERNVAAAALRTHRYAHPDVVQHGLFQVGALVTKRGQTAVTPKVMATATSTVTSTNTITDTSTETSEQQQQRQRQPGHRRRGPHLKEERQDHHQQQQGHHGEVTGDEVVEDAVVEEKRRNRVGR